MYSFNIATWVVSTLTVVIAVGMIAPLLSIYTYGPHNSGRITRIYIYMSHPLPLSVQPAYGVIPMLA